MDAADRPVDDPRSGQRSLVAEMCAYQFQHSLQTLSEGIEEYHGSCPGFADARSMSPMAREFFRCHDAVHVVFGGGLTLDDEAAVKIASIFGTTRGLGVLAGYRLHESVQIYRQLPMRGVLGAIGRSVIVVPTAMARCHRQHARWPWADFDHFLPVALSDIRQAFGIEVIHHRGSAV